MKILIGDALFLFHERKVSAALTIVFKIAFIAKAHVDKSLIFMSHLLLGSILYHLRLLNDAQAIFELLRDLTEEGMNPSHSLQTA